MSECRVVDLKELGVTKEVFDKIYSMGEQDGRADAIEELKPFIHTNVKGNKFVFIEDYNLHNLTFAEQLKEAK